MKTAAQAAILARDPFKSSAIAGKEKLSWKNRPLWKLLYFDKKIKKKQQKFQNFKKFKKNIKNCDY